MNTIANISFERDNGLFCPITGELMINPVIDNDGNTYERSAIEVWIKRNGTSPTTRNPLNINNLIPNIALSNTIKERIIQFSKQNLNNELVVNATKYKDEYNITITTPYKHINERIPTDIVAVVDVSGSMSSEATTSEGENTGLTLLDIVKHALGTVTAILGPNDRFSVITFSDNAKIIFGLTEMTENNKINVNKLIEPIQTEGVTNLNTGLIKGLDVIKERQFPECLRNSAILVLTDGVPSDYDHINMLKRHNIFPAPISTFGFGYNLDSILLKKIAETTGGNYSFIPDAGFVGTSFIHAISNILTTFTTNATIKINFDKETTLSSPPFDLNYTEESNGIIIKLGSIQSEQPRQIIFRVKTSTNPIISATLMYDMSSSDGKYPFNAITNSLTSNDNDIESDYILFKSIGLGYLHDLQENRRSGVNPDIADSIRIEYVDKIKEFNELTNKWLLDNKIYENERYLYTQEQGNTYARMEGLNQDFKGQIMIAIERKDYWTKWGRHFLPSIEDAHKYGRPNNFKDIGLQYYGGLLFRNIRDDADDKFNNLPPPTPKPSRSGFSSSSTNTPIVSMTSLNNRAAACFHGDCLVTMNNGNKKMVKDIRKGDLINNGEVVCILETIFSDKDNNNKTDTLSLRSGVLVKNSDSSMWSQDPIHFCTELVKINDLLITPWHPILYKGNWTFPCDINPIQEVECLAVYSFLIRNNDKYISTMIVNDIECVTLAHNLNKGITYHSFFGTNEIVKELEKCKNWLNGKVSFYNGFLLKDEESGLATGFNFDLEI